MRRLGAVFIACVALVALYLAAWPVPVDPVAWQAPQDKGLTGVFAANDALAAAGKVASYGRGRARRWITAPIPGLTTTLLLPAPLPID